APLDGPWAAPAPTGRGPRRLSRARPDAATAVARTATATARRRRTTGRSATDRLSDQPHRGGPQQEQHHDLDGSGSLPLEADGECRVCGKTEPDRPSEGAGRLQGIALRGNQAPSRIELLAQEHESGALAGLPAIPAVSGR